MFVITLCRASGCAHLIHSLLQKEETVEKGIYYALQDVMKERDEGGNQ
jgi:hypothetical protein